jgi:hypothetical protein
MDSRFRGNDKLFLIRASLTIRAFNLYSPVVDIWAVGYAGNMDCVTFSRFINKGHLLYAERFG